MKLQYLGDVKDSFKWDYLDHLAKALGFPTLTVVLMLTPDDETGHGGLQPEGFPASTEVLAFCNELRGNRERNILAGLSYEQRRDKELGRLRDLPRHTGADYSVILHKPDIHFDRWNRLGYFDGITPGARHLVFADPDNGFEPLHCNEKHIRFDEVARVMDDASEDSVVTVFQHFRHRRFAEDFAVIRAGLKGRPATAIYWNGHLMFVTVGKSAEVIEQVAAANRRYAERCPVVRAIG